MISPLCCGAHDPILSIAPTEQHGPHLPAETKVAIALGMLEELYQQQPHDLDFLVPPRQEIVEANVHVYGPGTFSFGPEILIPAWAVTGVKAVEAGLRKLMIVNSHAEMSIS